MPPVQPVELVQAILDAVEESGYSSLLMSSQRTHPRKFAISAPDSTALSLWVYAWTLTHGGRESLPNEYRIQMTSVASPLQLNPTGLTVLIGYEPNRKMLAGFDLSRHSVFTQGSPSVQIDIRTLDQALQNGLAFDRKSNNEIAIGVRPDQFVTYAVNADALHKYGSNAAILNMLDRAAALQTIPDSDLAAMNAPRKRVIQNVSRMSRAANFRKQVLQAYDYRCAVSKIQLRLVDAAHVLPVGAPGSTDDVRNGIALAPTFHRALDAGLIYLDASYNMRINARKKVSLATLHLDGGIQNFEAVLGRILLPPDRRQWPDVSLINKANQYRLIG
jgi:putative restriction endonuclease